ncbi:MAG: diguanylate cyclase [Elusimicrobia bacterium]|nr:diguanylate cyclase [Elusimicrobiota bacterium]
MINTMDLDERSITYLTDLADLEDKGHRIVESLAGDISATDLTQRLMERLRTEKKDIFYSDVLFYLTSERYPEAQAKTMWGQMITHKYLMSEKLGRNVGIRVAAIDYLLNVRKLLYAPRVIKSSEFRQTVKLARTDSLTGLFNRRYFMEQTTRILEAANRLKVGVTLMMSDLDNFKQFNDKHGHQAGDLLLQEVGRIVRSCVRNSDIVARYGGDEFALILPKAARMDAAPVAEKIRKQIEENCYEMGVTISIGLAQYPVDAKNRDDLISAADEVLYRAKEFGGNRVSLFQPTIFTLKSDDPHVQQVCVVGDFNNWNKRTHLMTRLPSGNEWEIAISIKPGRYRYKFLVNNTQWLPDPSAQEFESDGFGGQCSILVVK